MEPPDTQYALSDGLHIAYQIFGNGPDAVLIPPLVSNVELSWDHELYRRVLEHDRRHVRLLMFDKRGIGASDRFEKTPTLDERIRDIAAVMDAEGIERASLMGLSEGGIMAQLFAARHPERVEKLVLINTSAGVGAVPFLRDHLRPDDRPLDLEEFMGNWARLVETWGVDPSFMIDWMMPSQRDNVSFARWIGRLQRQTASPADIQRQIESILALDTMPSLDEIRAPTLVIHVTGDQVLHVTHGRVLADKIPNATYVEIAGDDHFLWVMPNWREMASTCLSFIVGQPIGVPMERRFAAVLFTDLVDSTARSARAGDAAWHDTLESHHRICHDVVDRFRGRVVKHTGDGMLAVFDSPSQAVGAASEIVSKLDGIDLGVRAGIHAGEIEVLEDGDVSGTAINIAARVEQTADLGCVFVSSTVRDLLIGGEHRFAERGEHELKGVEGSWRLYSLER